MPRTNRDCCEVLHVASPSQSTEAMLRIVSPSLDPEPVIEDLGYRLQSMLAGAERAPAYASAMPSTPAAT